MVPEKIEIKKKIGVIAMFKISSGGGAPRVTIDLINALHELGNEVHLLTPFKIDFEKIQKMYGKIDVEKIYSLEGIKTTLCRGRILPRKLMIKQFSDMANEVDFIVDIDGGIFHNFIPDKFDKTKYVFWRISCVKPASEREWIKRDWKEKLKEKILDILGEKKCILSKEHKIYPVDKWTAKELKENWNIDSEEDCLYPEIKVNELVNENKDRSNKIIVFGRIAPNKSIDDSVRIFALGTKTFPEYELIILGGATSNTDEYILSLRKLGEELGISDKIKFIKNPSFEEIKKILQDSKVIIDSQKEISLTMTSIEAMAAGNIVLGYKNSGGYLDILENGKYGFGFLDVSEGGKVLAEILAKLKDGEIDNKEMIKRAKEFSGEKFKKRVKEIIEDGI